MTASLDPVTCRLLAEECQNDRVTMYPGATRRTIADQLLAAADLAERTPLTEGERFTLVLAAVDKKLKAERPALCALLDRMLAGQLAPAFDSAARAITGQPAAALTEQLKPATAAIGPDDSALIDRALAYLTRVATAAERAAIDRIRKLLGSPGGGS